MFNDNHFNDNGDDAAADRGWIKNLPSLARGKPLPAAALVPASKQSHQIKKIGIVNIGIVIIIILGIVILGIAILSISILGIGIVNNFIIITTMIILTWMI